MADLIETLQKLEALQHSYASRDAATGEPIAEDLVVTLDIGSTFTRCTFAFQTEDECLDIYVCNFQNEVTGSSDTKAPTSVLVNEEGRFVSFGYAARKDYADFGRSKGYYMFEEFYSMLHEQKNLDESTLTRSVDGRGEVPVLHIISMLLTQLKIHVVKEASDKTEGKKHACASWVLLAPAQWNQQKMLFLRKAACKAGLINHVDSPKLRLIRSEEAALTYCSGLDTDDFFGKQSADALVNEPGDKCLVVDAGGSTLRSTIYELKDDGCKPLHFEMSCGPVGSHIDHVFANIMGQVFGKQFIDKLKMESLDTWQDVTSAFAEKKHSTKRDTPGSVKINLPSKFRDTFETAEQKSINEAVKRSRINGLKYIAPNLWLSTDTIRSCYKRINDFIIDHITDLLSQHKDIKRIYLIGGFFESDIVRYAVMEAIGDTTVLIPVQPSKVASMFAIMSALEEPTSGE